MPNDKDGVPFITQEPIMSGQNYSYNFKLQQKGSYWMHSHYMFQTQKGLSAPLFIHDSKNKNDYQEVITPSKARSLTDVSSPKGCH